MNISRIIVVDIGNTSTQAAIAHGSHFVSVRRMASNQQTGLTVSRFLGAYAHYGKIKGAIVCSVVPSLGKIWARELGGILDGPVMLLNHKLNLGIKLKYPHPGTIGADRLANVAAVARHGVPAIVVDIGTGLTVDAISAKGEFIGGIIAPGPMMFTDYMSEKTALLPSLNPVVVKEFLRKPSIQPAVGRNTRQAMLLGLRLGYIGLLKEILAHMARQKGFKKARIYATGGHAKMMLAGTDLRISIDPLLTLRGISLIYWLNR